MMSNALSATADLIPSSARLSPAEVLEIRASSLSRLATLLRVAQGAWVLAVYESSEIKRLTLTQLGQAVAPLMIIEVSLAQRTPDPLRIVRQIESNGEAPIISFDAIGNQLTDLAGFLDIQRDLLATYPHRLIFWVSERDRWQLAQKAPNFYSRLSGVFYFPGSSLLTTDSVAVTLADRPIVSTTESRDSASRRRPYLPIRDERQRGQQIDFLSQRIHDLTRLPRPNFVAIGDSWYDLAGVYETAIPRRWQEAEAAYGEAARAYAQAGSTLAEAEARFQAGDAARRSYQHKAAAEHFKTALNLYRLLAQSPSSTPEAVLGEANVLRAQGDVLAFMDQRDEALGRYEQALALYRAVGDRLGEANVLKAQGDVLAFMAQRDEALGRYEQALALYRAVGDRLGEANVLRSQGDVLAFMDQRDEALGRYEQALALYRAVGARLGEANVLKAQGDVLAFMDQRDEALGRYEQALALYRAVGARLGEANVAFKRGEVARQAQQFDEANTFYQQALAAYRLIGARVGIANVLDSLGELAETREDWESAVAYFESALQGYEAIYASYASVTRRNLARSRRGYAESLINLARLDDAAAQLDAAAALEPEAPYLALRWAELAKARDDRAGAARWAEEALRRHPAWDEAEAILAWSTSVPHSPINHSPFPN